MARSTPTYTPARNYVISFLLSAFILYGDINYNSFASLRVVMNASKLYIKTISEDIIENINFIFSSLKENHHLLKENQELRDQIFKARAKDLIEKKDYEEKIKIIDFQEILSDTFKNNEINVYKVASIDLTNYFCCSSHKIFLHNPNKVGIEKNVSVFAGDSFVGQTKKSYMNFIEVILLSDAEHVLPIKSDFFYCDARGKGKPMLISCKINKDISNFENKIGDTVYTSGLGGIFIKDVELGFISEIIPTFSNEIEVVIYLKANPLEENFYGVISKVIDEI